MKKLSIFLAISVIAIVFSNCNNPANKENTADAGNSTSAVPTNKDACKHPLSAADSAKLISTVLEVKGDVEHALLLTVDSLKKMNAVTINNYKVVCQSGASNNGDSTCRGVLLKDIIDKAKIKQANHKDRNFYIVARATDNYMATFSWGEVFNNVTGENTYVIFEENGQPIKSRGSMILICNGDIKTGPRHVRWLKSIEVNRVK